MDDGAASVVPVVVGVAVVGVGCAVSSPASSLDPAFFLRVEKPRLSMPGTMG